MKQTSFQQTKWAHRFSHGGALRQARAGRSARPLSRREPIHLVFKTNKGLSGAGLRSARRFRLVQVLLRKYARRFHVNVEQVSVQFDHIHLLVRITRRSLFQHFLRVLAGQIAQQFQAHGLSLKPMPGRASKASVTDTHGPQTQRSKNKPDGSVTGTPGPRSQRAKSKPDRSVTGTPKDQAPGQSTELVQPKNLPLWKYRPFTRVIRGWKAYCVVRGYVQLNEKEATGEVRYSIRRLRGLLAEDLARLWC
jgi:REP element-mobilizing transposase RayT